MLSYRHSPKLGLNSGRELTVQELSLYRPAPFRPPVERAWIRWTWWAPRGIRRGKSLVGGMREGDQGRQEQPIFPKASQAFSTDWGSRANCCASLIFVWKSSYHFQLEGCTLKMGLQAGNKFCTQIYGQPLILRLA